MSETATPQNFGGTDIRAVDEGSGPVILILHPGLDDGGSWGKVAQLLTPRFRVIRMVRTQYRLDLPSPVTMADEVEDVLEIAAAIGQPITIVGHSSGAVVALETLVVDSSPFTAAVLYEPPIALGATLGGEATVRAQAAMDAGKPGKAMQIFIRDIVKMPGWQAALARVFITRDARLTSFVPRQMADTAAIDALGMRLDAYAGIETPTLLVGGDKSPKHLAARLDALQSVLPHVRREVIQGQGHGAHDAAPQVVADLIAGFATV